MPKSSPAPPSRARKPAAASSSSSSSSSSSKPLASSAALPAAVRTAKLSAAAAAELAGLAELILPSPIGPLRLLADDDSLYDVYFPNNSQGALLREGPPVRADARQRSGALDHPVLRETARQLDEYFAGTRRDFDLPLNTRGTEFQQRVWRKLCEIPFAATWSYGTLATECGNPNASRAVGAANGRNPIPVIIPCHRVIGSNGSLTGFGGGEPAKRWLLDHEAKVAGLRLF